MGSGEIGWADGITPAERRQQLLAAFRESGMTRTAFSRREGMCYTTLCTWGEKEAKTAGRESRPEALVRFAEVAMPASASPGVQVLLPDDTLLRSGSTPELAALVRAVRGRAPL